jgi:hypothetical protein
MSPSPEELEARFRHWKETQPEEYWQMVERLRESWKNSFVTREEYERLVYERDGGVLGEIERRMAAAGERIDQHNREMAESLRALRPAEMSPPADPFETQDQRENAVNRAQRKLGIVKEVANVCGVDYHKLRAWVRSRHAELSPAREHSEIADKIERTLKQVRWYI